MVEYNKSELNYHVNRARMEGIRVRANKSNPNLYLATSGADGKFKYAVAIVPGRENTAVCTCVGGTLGNQCKHSAASIAAHNKRLEETGDQSWLFGPLADAWINAAQPTGY